MQKNEIVKSYGDLIQLLSSKYELEVSGGVLYGKNWNSGKIYQLAIIDMSKLKFFPVPNVMGFLFIQELCTKFNELEMKIIKHESIDITFEVYAKKFFATISRGQSYSNF